MSSLRFVLILIGTAISFFVGSNLIQDIVGALVFAVIALLLMVFVTKPLKKKQFSVSFAQPKETLKRKSGEKHTIATIRRIWHSPPPGAPWYYWTYVLFEARGEPIELKLTKRQANNFVKIYSEGETGHLVYKGKNLVSWQNVSSQRPLRPQSNINVFLSYAHEWSDDAAYISQVFRSHGLNVWIDTGEIRTGDKLGNRVLNAIQNADYFVALLSPEYFASPWCIRELEAAADEGRKVLPIKVSEGDLVLPPHIRKLYESRLEEPVFLDIRKRDPSAKLAELAEQMFDK